MHMGLILNGYGGMGIWNVAWLEQVIYGKKDFILQYSTLNKAGEKITLYSLCSR
jgi:hypothetical protein